MKDLRRRQFLFIAVLSYVLFSSNIGGVDLYPYDEARNAGCAWEMMITDEWLIPSFNGDLRFHKPPLHYYPMIIGYKVFGYGPFGARLFSSICGVFTVLLLYLFASKYFDPDVALFSALALLGSIHFALQVHMAVPDPYLILLLTAALLLLYHSIQIRSAPLTILSYAILGLASLTKGPVAIAIGILAVFYFMIFSRNFSWPFIKKLKLHFGLPVLMAVTIPWYYYIGKVTSGEYTEGFFLVHNLQRFSAPMEGHGGSFLVTWLFILVGMLPFSVYIIQSFAQVWREKAVNPVLTFIFSCGLAVITIFTLSQTRLPNYTVPAYPFVALILAYYISTIVKKDRLPFHFKLSTIVFLIFSIAGPVGAFFAFQNDPSLSDLKHLALYLLPLSLGGILSVIFVLKNDGRRSVISQVASTMIVTMLFFYIVYPKFDAVNPTKVLSPMIEKDADVWAYKLYNPAFVISLERIIPPLHEEEDLKLILEKSSDGYLITRKNYMEELSKYPQLEFKGSHKDLFELSTSVVYKINSD
ncbi:MAG: glycosyltransferase family 39 protein [Chitinophagales bacterium]|nr:glycosyltransferase family 39 protein [Chitinophagales bacterium]